MKEKAFVGLSGGVDSSVSAALLKKAGYEVTGVFIKVWNPTSERLNLSGEVRFNLFDSCQAADDRLDAMRVCATLGIPFVELNLEKEYKKEVVDYMIAEYRKGRTPNPDVMCNRFIKFGAFYKWAMKEGADFVATGHYARITTSRKAKPRHLARFRLSAGGDKNKDQSYFLWQIRQEQLPQILFPVGGMQKTEVRKLAKKYGLITAEKKDSQGLCFVGKIDMKEFLAHYIKPKKGKVKDEKERVVAEHTGATFYTLGERFPLAGAAVPHFVVAKDMKKNLLIVSPKSGAGELSPARREVEITDCNWLSGEPREGKTYGARVRYRQPLQPCTVARKNGRTYVLMCEKGESAAAGQSLVLYDGEVCLGGGTIA